MPFYSTTICNSDRVTMDWIDNFYHNALLDLSIHTVLPHDFWLDYFSLWMNEWMNEWMSEWMNEWMNSSCTQEKNIPYSDSSLIEKMSVFCVIHVHRLYG